MNRNRLKRSNTDYVFLGVCGGIAEVLSEVKYVKNDGTEEMIESIDEEMLKGWDK